MSDAPRYKAFLSYSHRDTRAVAWLHRRLEGYRVPRALRGRGIGERLSPVFRDRDELASSAALSDSIQAALDSSAALVVACSPAASASRWVNEEIRYFRRRHPERKVLAFILEGDPGADPRRDPERACFPLALLLRDIENPDADLVEPASPDARREADGRDAAFLKLAAGLLELPFDTLRQRELRRQQQRWTLLGAGSLMLAAVFAALAWQAMIARDAARVAQARAELEAQTARQTSDFMVSLFQVSDPGEARGNSITAREVLDRGVERIGGTTFARPLIKARLLGTMGKVYAYLGLYLRAIELLGNSENMLQVNDPGSEEAAQRFDLIWELADLHYLRGDYPAAAAVLERIGPLDRRLPQYGLREAKRLNLQGDLRFQDGDDTAARTAYGSALEILSAGGDDELIQRARALGGLGRIDHFAGDIDAARRELEAAHSALLERWGEDHPDTLAALNELGGVAYQGGDSVQAELLWSRTLAAGERIYGPEHPEVASFLNNLALVRLESCRFGEAEPQLVRSVAIDRAARSEEVDDLAYKLNSLALSLRARGATRESEQLMREALQVAQEHKHRMLGPIGNNLADLVCVQDRREEGVALATAAVAAASAEYGAEHWRTRQAELTLAYCREDATDAAPRALDGALDTLLARWGEHNLYSQRALQQLEEIARRHGDSQRAREFAARLDASCIAAAPSRG